jgi:deoxyribonuclease-4
VLCHAVYLVNLATPDPVVYERSVAALRNTTEVAAAIGADGVVLHVGSHLGSGFEAGVEHVVPALEEVLELCTDETWLLMENSAGAGGTIGRSIEELAVLHERLGRHPRLGICLDSCHLYASGYDVTDPKEVDNVVKQIDKAMGIDRVRALHINDSATPLGSNRDRHANVLEGELGEGMGAFLAHPAFQHLSCYLEVPGVNKSGPNAQQIQALRDLHARWT